MIKQNQICIDFQNKIIPIHSVLLFIYCGVFVQSKNCGGRETAVTR
jgi:hypothetical protein